jgi:hypothetical protein
VSGSDINVKLFGDSGGNPVGPALATFTHPADFAGFNAEANEFVTPLSSVTLLPSLTYWLVVGDTATSGFFGWEATAANTYSGIATYAGARQQQNNDPPQTSTGCCFIFQIDATPITGAATPEPSTLGVCALGLFALLYAKRRLG